MSALTYIRRTPAASTPAMTVTRAVIDTMIATGAPAEQAAGLAECLQISTIAHVNTFPTAFPEMNFIYAMTVRREFRTSFIRWHNENCPLDDVWEMAPDEGTWDDVDWPTYEHEIKDEIIDYFYDLSASQSAA